jgi:phosphomannomutase / phosphoglucomutase
MADLKTRCRKPSPAVSLHCSDVSNTASLIEVMNDFEAMQNKAGKVAGQPMLNLVTVKRRGHHRRDCSSGLVRASANQPGFGGGRKSGQRTAHARLCEAMDSVLALPEVGKH